MWGSCFTPMLGLFGAEIPLSIILFHPLSQGAFVTTVTATDADDEAYGNSAKLVYSILQGQPYFSIEPETGKLSKDERTSIV